MDRAVKSCWTIRALVQVRSKLRIWWALYDVTLLPGNPSMPLADDSLRIDRWLFYCRFFKTRVLATAAVTGGHVKLNGERTTPGARVKCGDRVDLIRERLPYSLGVVEIPARRGPAAEARNCFVEDEETVEQRAALVATLKQDRMLLPKTDGRPDKHTRRKLRERGRN
jgi:ribosome-associated heat shock protein Hsp15